MLTWVSPRGPSPAWGLLPYNVFKRHQLNTVRAQKAAKRISLNDHIFKFEIKSQVDTKPPSWKQSACLVISQHTATWTHTHSDTRSYTHNTHTHTRAHGHPDMDTHTVTHTATPRTHTLTHRDMDTQTWTHTQKNTQLHPQYAHSHTGTWAPRHGHTYRETHTATPTDTQLHV